MMRFLFYIAVFFITYTGVKTFRQWSLRRKIYDVPNERSSHSTPTARGGGLIIVLVSLSAYASYAIFVTDDFQWSYLIGALLIAAVSWLDDLYTISFGWRFLIHSLAAILIIFALGCFKVIYFPFFYKIDLGATGAIATFLWIVWLTNAYNFMDGIDGIAGMQAVTAGVGWLVIGEIFGLQSVGFYGGIIASASLGFLIQNWQPAKIFMGDVGSAFLGFTFAVLPILAKNEIGERAELQKFIPLIAVLLVWLFMFDSTFTFVRRTLRREKIWQAHRGHIYQRLVVNGFSHQSVTILYGSISILTGIGAILWSYRPEAWKAILIPVVGIESIGLLLILYFICKGKLFS